MNRIINKHLNIIQPVLSTTPKKDIFYTCIQQIRMTKLFAINVKIMLELYRIKSSDIVIQTKNSSFKMVCLLSIIATYCCIHELSCDLNPLPAKALSMVLKPLNPNVKAGSCCGAINSDTCTDRRMIGFWSITFTNTKVADGSVLPWTIHNQIQAKGYIYICNIIK